eukprot:2303051-Pleurochrysis_carterae.AAC.1
MTHHARGCCRTEFRDELRDQESNGGGHNTLIMTHHACGCCRTEFRDRLRDKKSNGDQAA